MFKPTLLAVAATTLLAGCATILSKVDYPVNLVSEAEGTKVSVVDEMGVTVFTGTTPAQVTLPAGKSYFNALEYSFIFQKEGQAAQTVKIKGELDPWYFGNILFGGIPGLLIVDPLTGAMFKLPETITPTGVPAKKAETDDKSANSVYIMTTDQLSAVERASLQPIN